MLHTSSNYSHFSASTALIFNIYPHLFLVNNLTKFRKFLLRGCGSSSSSEKPCLNANAKHPLPLPHPPSESRNIIPNDLALSSIHVRNTPPLLYDTLLLMSKPAENPPLRGSRFELPLGTCGGILNPRRHFYMSYRTHHIRQHISSSLPVEYAEPTCRIPRRI